MFRATEAYYFVTLNLKRLILVYMYRFIVDFQHAVYRTKTF